MTQLEDRNDKHQTLEVKSGARIVTENELSRKMYVILSGKARVSKKYIGQRITLAVLGEGEIFGEMSFIDAQPRSASVDALTDMKLIVLDADAGLNDFKNLPTWIWTVMRTVFFRFRELDRQILSLQSVVNFRKKGMKSDVVASSIYLEVKRFLKTMQLLWEREHRFDTEDTFREELDTILGNRAVSLREFWKQLLEADLVRVDKDGKLQFHHKSIAAFNGYLDAEIAKERYLILPHVAIAILRRLVAFMPDDQSESDQFDLDFKNAKISQIPDWETGLAELTKLGVLSVSSQNVLSMKKDTVHELFVFQSFLKVFDHATINID